MTRKLHCFAESGNAYKCALALELAGLDWQPVFVDFFKGETRSDTWRDKVNPMGEVPVLEDGDLRLTQSGVILDHVAACSGTLGGDRHEILRWLFWDNHKFSTQIGMTRFLMNFLPEDKRPQAVIDFKLSRLKAAYGVLNDHLNGRDWIVARDVTIADLSVCGYLYYSEPFGFERADWPEIDRWLSNIQSLPGWQHPYDLMPREAVA